MPSILLIALGGAIGSVLRYLLAQSVHLFFERGFPMGTLAVNFIGSLLIGFLSVIIFRRVSHQALSCFWLIGFLGGFTTFSTFSLDTVNLMTSGKIVVAVTNVALSVGLCLLATFLGIWLAD